MLRTIPFLVLISCGNQANAPNEDASAPPEDGSVVHALDSSVVHELDGSVVNAPDLAPPAVAKVLGYYTGVQASYDAIESFHTSLDIVSADVYDVTANGTIAGSDDLGAIARDQSHGIDTFACVANFNDTLGDFDPALGHAALVTYKDAVITSLLAIARSGYRGINIDFESIAYSANIDDDRAAYSAFIHELALQLHAAGLALMVSVPAKSADSMTDTWSYPYDFAAVGADVDYVQLMTYDENGPGWSPPGPVAGVDWVASSLAYATSVIDPAKILIGLPAYGYDWDVTASTANKSVGVSVPWTGFAALLAMPGATPHFDVATASPYVDYTASDGHKHEAWYENTASVIAKTQLVGRYHLGGVSMWALGEEDASFWQAVHAGL
jgi:spore germination protein YaaH